MELSGATLLPETSFALLPGRCAAVRGPNGAGKTTLLRVLAGRLRPTSGRATLFERRLDERARTVRQHVAALIEPPVLYPDLTLRDQIALIVGAWAGAAARPDVRPAAWPGLGEEAIDRFEIRHLETRFPHELSSGQRQLVSLAVTFARPGSVLLLDEPEQRLDPHRRGLLGDAILAARESGVAVAFASHDAELVARVADTSLHVGGAAV
ncbi:Molybdenum transport ATP-binding protein ModC (TC 3.A.1.8.1) [Leucobacter sp. 7(1)]|uniref:ABC transporter ATP-binding protein n=1 Tax=Leucobacter sp. 7(1) TaxID=1255613 RepID=UPI00097E80BB|nr:ABC transporter ATP-binding protein [Leucobacter sp. 7(1)]SJN12776.1 Molybdenum transport ATP-binding protein ModC (TC 3.A.1.8.1) [Leucobacter sp. 7(1)]